MVQEESGHRLLRNPEDATIGEIKSLAASVLSQDETKGKR